MSLLLRRPPGREGYPGDVWASVRLYLCMFLFTIKKYKKLIKNNKTFKNKVKYSLTFKRNYSRLNKIYL